VYQADHLTGNLDSGQLLVWKNMQACQTVTNNTCPDINAALLPVSGLEDAMRIVLCPLVMAVKIYAISTKTCLI
jgi:hypothetical protein